MNHFRNHILLYTLVPLVLVLGLASYNRFIANHDYTVAYEGECDPTSESCFVGCEDDECTEEYYYMHMQKHAADLYRQCGPDITECEAASQCLPEDGGCTMTFCDAETDGEMCETQEGEDEETTEEDVSPEEY